jgi:glyoxylase-like metal-dependent hydrolase (beta-lactamase superfamily II)
MASSSSLPPGYEPPPGLFDRWREVAAGVLVRRHRVLDLNVTVVLGDDRALVVDTHGHAAWARELVGHVRQVTSLPWVVVNTHAHFDHAFGNTTFSGEQPGVELWGHVRCVEALERYGELQRHVTAEALREAGQERDAVLVEDVAIQPPNRTLAEQAVLDLGGRSVHVRHLGRGHTDHDVVVDVPDGPVTVAGDLVEQGAPPSFEDAYPLEWPATLDALLPLLRGPVVPGHGDVVNAEFVAGLREDLQQLADVARGLPDGVTEAEVVRAAAGLRIGRRAGLEALRRSLALRA